MSEFIIAALICTGFVYGTSATAKLSSRRAYLSYRDGLSEASLVPSSWLPALAAALAAGEALVAAAQIAAVIATATSAGRTVSEASLATAAALTGVLTVGVAIILRRGTAARCACFGASSVRPLSVAHLCRNVSLLVLVIVGLMGAMTNVGGPTLAGLVVAIPSAAVAGLLLTRLDDLVDLFAPVPTPGSAKDVVPPGPRASVSRSPQLQRYLSDG